MNEKRKAIEDTLNNENSSSLITVSEKDKYKYYVYALCEKKPDNTLIPFYIGKGEGGRVWAHKEGKEKEIQRIRTEIEDEQERQTAIGELSDKYRRLNSIGKENLEMVIVKWGMTKNEAFMAESALINLLKLGGLSFSQAEDQLTNIQNGHASKGEKDMGDTSTARTLDQFYKDCAREPLPFEEIRDAILININRGYLECTSLFADERELAYAIQEVTRGFWGLNDSITPKYLYALYQQRIVGVYRIKKQTKQVRKKKQVHTVPCYYTFLDVWREDYPTFDRLPSRRKDRELANKLYQACRKDAEGKVAAAPSYDELPNDLKAEVRAFFGKLNKGETYEKKLKLLVNRKYLVVEAIGDTDPDARMNELVGRRIVKTYTDQNGDLKSSSPNGQNPRSYSLDLLSGR